MQSSVVAQFSVTLFFVDKPMDALTLAVAVLHGFAFGALFGSVVFGTRSANTFFAERINAHSTSVTNHNQYNIESRHAIFASSQTSNHLQQKI